MSIIDKQNSAYPKAPLSVCWRITRACNLNCRFCLSGNKGAYKNSLSTQQALRIIKHLFNIGVKRISFTGGEPLLRKDLPLLLETGKNFGLQCVVTTNSLLINARWLKIFKDYADLVRVSLHGDKKTHDVLMGQALFKKTVDKIEKLSKYGVQVAINCMMTQKNKNKVEEVVKIAKNLGVKMLYFMFFIPHESAKGCFDLCLDQTDIKEVTCTIRHLRTPCDMMIKVNDYSRLDYTYIVIENDGTITAPAFNPNETKIFGNILNTPLDQVWNIP